VPARDSTIHLPISTFIPIDFSSPQPTPTLEYTMIQAPISTPGPVTPTMMPIVQDTTLSPTLQETIPSQVPTEIPSIVSQDTAVVGKKGKPYNNSKTKKENWVKKDNTAKKGNKKGGKKKNRI